MTRNRFIPLGLAIVVGLALGGCFSRKLAVMDLHDTLTAIADELCGIAMKPDDVPKVTLATATGMTVGTDAATLGIPINASATVSDSTQIEVILGRSPLCPSKTAEEKKKEEEEREKKTMSKEEWEKAEDARCFPFGFNAGTSGPYTPTTRRRVS
jgi:hypothetical protein